MNASSSVKFPLPDGYFPSVELTAAEIAVYEQRVEIIMKNAMAEYNLHEAMGARPEYGSRWTVVGNVEHLTAIHEVDPSRAVESSRIFGRVDGDYRNFIDFYYSTTAHEVFAVNQFMFGYAVDGAVLCNIHTKESQKPHVYLGMKWVCLQPSTLSRKRDMCFLEYLVYTKDLQGRDVGVRITLPLLLDQCPPLPEKLKTRRIHSHTVTIVRPTSDNVDATQIFTTSEVDMHKGSSTSSVATFKKLMTTLSSMALFADSKRISAHGILDRRSWAPKSARPHCIVCSRKFSTTRRRQHCRLCGELACRRCMTIRDAAMFDDSSPPTTRTFQVVKTVFCKACMGKVRGTDVMGVVGADSHDEGVSDAESSSWFTDNSLDGDYNFAMTNRSLLAMLSPAEASSTNSFILQSDTTEESEEEANVDQGVSLPKRKFSTCIDLEVLSETKTSVSSSLDGEGEVEVTEPTAPMTFDLRHLRTIAGAERVVQEAEEEELRTMRESLAALDLKPVSLADFSLVGGDEQAEELSSNRSDEMPLMEENDDENEDDGDDVIEIIDESTQIVSSTRQIVSSPLCESPLTALTEKSFFGPGRSNVSIDQRLQEQEVLLKRLVMAANSSGYYGRGTNR
uniref:FYVE-type domain-containing protein n=1 Tax=Hyaloperonospora arabidopsidis (strain Emoy2) TaxID=559515 RepID=M4BX56_HYAAE